MENSIGNIERRIQQTQNNCLLHNLCYTKDTKRAERELDSLVDR